MKYKEKDILESRLRELGRFRAGFEKEKGIEICFKFVPSERIKGDELGDIDEQKEMKKVLINELRHLIEDRELVDVKNRTITLLEEKEVEELKRVLEKLNS